MSKNSEPTRYSDQDLAEFKSLLEQKLEKSTLDYNSLLDQIRELGENADAEKADIFDNSVSLSEGEMLQTMAHRTKKYIQNLQNALHRIRNKTYGICFKSGRLIDKRRLMAVPTTTQSLEVKLAPPPKPEVKEKPVSKNAKKIIEKKIKPLPKKAAAGTKILDDDEEDLDGGLDFEVDESADFSEDLEESSEEDKA